MKKRGQVLVINCSFNESGKKLPELMLGCLRHFAERNIRDQTKI